MAFLNEKGTKTLRDDYVQRIQTVSTSLESDYVKSTALTEQLGEYVKSEDLTSQLNDYVQKSALEEEVKKVYGTVASFGGSVDNYEALSTEKQDAKEGTIINCTDTGENYIKTSDGWDKFDIKVDLEAYVKSESLTTTLQSYVTTETLEGKKYVDEDTLTSKNYVDSATLEGKNYIDEDTLNSKNFIDESALTEKNYVDESTLTSKNYVDEETLTSKNFVDSDTLDSKNFVTEEELGTKLEAISDEVIGQIVAGTYGV